MHCVKRTVCSALVCGLVLSTAVSPVLSVPVFASEETEGRAAASASTYRVEYVVEGEKTYEDVFVEGDEEVDTPMFKSGPLYKSGQAFKGWSPEVEEYVTGNVTYTAQFEKDKHAAEIEVEFVNVSDKLDPALIGTVDVIADGDEVYWPIEAYRGGKLCFSTDDVSEINFSNVQAGKGLMFCGAKVTQENGNLKFIDKSEMDDFSEPYVDGMHVTFYVGMDEEEYQKYLKNEDNEANQQCTITYDTRGGSAVGSQTLPYNTEVTMPTPTWDGHKFIGWFDRPVGGEELNPTFKLRGDVTVYAYWEDLYPGEGNEDPDDLGDSGLEVKEFTVKFDPQGGSAVEPQKVKDGNAVTMLTPVRAGYEFLGWFTAEAGGTALKEYYPNKNATLYAHWKVADDSSGGSDNDNNGDDNNNGSSKQKYTVTFDSQGGSSVSPITDVKNTKITMPASPTREGYDFLGWFTSPEGGDKVTGVILKADVTLYAHWSKTPMSYTITYIDGVDGKAFTSVSYTAKEGDATPAFGARNPVYIGYVFKGWSPEVSEKVTGTVVYKAVWEKVNEHDGSSVSNNGKGGVSDNNPNSLSDNDNNPNNPNNPGGNGNNNGSNGGNGGRSDMTAEGVRTADANAKVLYGGLGVVLSCLMAGFAVVRRRLKLK